MEERIKFPGYEITFLVIAWLYSAKGRNNKWKISISALNKDSDLLQLESSKETPLKEVRDFFKKFILQRKWKQIRANLKIEANLPYVYGSGEDLKILMSAFELIVGRLESFAKIPPEG